MGSLQEKNRLVFVKTRKGRNRVSYVERSYDTPNEAIGAVKRLQEEGYKKEAIRLISNTEGRIAFMEQFTQMSRLKMTTQINLVHPLRKNTIHYR